MATLRIHDSKNYVLAFDLRDLVSLLAPQSLQATWVVSTVKSAQTRDEWFEATGKGGEQLEALAENNARLSGAELSMLAEDTLQVIWGEFIALLPSNLQEPWVTIRAIDSSFYEIATLDDAVLEKIGSTFSDIRFVERP
jgi:hypothetical protein